MGVIDRVFTWRADDVITQITDQIRGVETSYDVDPMGRVTRVTHQQAGSTATQNMPQTREKRAGREESYSYSQAGVLTKLHPDMTKRWADDVDSYGGTMPHQVGRTKFTYDKAGRVTQTVTKRLSKKPLVKHFYYDNGTQPVGYEDSDHPGVGWRYLYDGACRRVGKEQINTTTGEVTSRVMFLHEGDVLFGEYHAVNVMDPHMVGSAVLWPTDPGTGEILGQITINTNTTGSVTGQDGGNGYYPSGYSEGTGADNSADDPYSQHNNPNNGDGAGGVLGWPQQRVDAVFYSMVCDLAGAPKELIDPATGEVVGYATYTLFGKRHWAGPVSTPLLFTGQYEDTESGWVYNRFRYYDPHAGVYNAQDPLGLLANLGTAQGYVTNPVTWVDALGLKACKRNRKRKRKHRYGINPLREHINKIPLVEGEPALSNILKKSDDPLQKLVNDIVRRVDPPIKTRDFTLAIAPVEVTFMDGNKAIKWLAATSGKNNKPFEKIFEKLFPVRKDVILLDRMAMSGLGSAHAEETIVSHLVKADITGDYSFAGKYVSGVRPTDIVVSRAVCNSCAGKIKILDEAMVDKLGDMAEARRLEVYEAEEAAVNSGAKLARNRFEAVNVRTPLKLLTLKKYSQEYPNVNPWDHIDISL